MRWLLLAIVAFGCKGNPEKCDKACRNYAQLVYWEKADAEIAAAPPEKRDELRKQKLTKFTNDLEKGITMCSSQCISASGMGDGQVDCMINAKTAQQAKDCSGH